MSGIYPIAVPKWGIEMVEGTITTWNKAVGETVSKDDEVFEMESDKIVNVWESPVDGVLRRVLVEEGEAKEVGGLLGIIAAADVDDGEIDAFIESFAGNEPAANTSAPAVEPTVAAPPPATTAPASTVAPSGDGSRRVNPVIRRLAQELGVDLDTVVGSGRNGRLTKEDIEAAATAAPQGQASAEPVRDDVEITTLSATRKTIGKRLTQAKQDIPHFYLGIELEIDGLLAHRAKLNKDSEQRVSINDLLVWCVARALMKEPKVNVNLVDDQIHQFKQANVSIALATDDGLYPVTLRAADTLSPAQIAAATAAAAERAATGKLTREDLTGGSFTVSNLGMYGVDSFTAIVNPPMGAILAVGRGQQKVVVRDGDTAVANVISATLSCDHRVIDGAVGAKFLAALKAELTAL
ncbi:MAG: dihydrolipoamide acetyltransferase family protein [Halioglobus sp.]